MVEAAKTPDRLTKRQSMRGRRRKTGNTAQAKQEEEEGSEHHARQEEEDDDGASVAESRSSVAREQTVKQVETTSPEQATSSPLSTPTKPKQDSKDASTAAGETGATLSNGKLAKPKSARISKPNGVVDDDTAKSMPPPSTPVANEGPSNSVVERTPSRDTGGDVSDDASSVTGPVRTRKRKSEDERIAWFHEDEQCLEVEPHRALCRHCGKWIDLHPKMKYVMKQWVAHRRAGCTITVTFPQFPPPAASNTQAPAQKPAGDVSQEKDVPASTADAAQPNPEPKELPNDSDSTSPVEPPHDGVEPIETAGVATKRTLPDSVPEPSAPDISALSITRSSPGEGQEPSQSPETPSSKALGKRKRDDGDGESDSDASVGWTPARKRAAHSRSRSGVWSTLTAPIRSFFDGFVQGISGAFS